MASLGFHVFLNFCKPFCANQIAEAGSFNYLLLQHVPSIYYSVGKKSISNSPECTLFWLVLISGLLIVPLLFYQVQTNLGALI